MPNPDFYAILPPHEGKGAKAMAKKVKRLVMSENQGVAKDVNLYVLDEKNLYTKTHAHTFFEFMLVTQGMLRQTINGEERVLSENDVCILRPDSVHTLSTCDDAPVILYNFEVSPPYVKTLCEALGFQEIEKILSSTVSYTRCTGAEAMDYIKIITIPHTRTNLMRSDVKESTLKIIVTRLLMSLILNPAPRILHKKEDSAISTMMALLEDKNNFTLTIKELCEKTFYTQEHITRLFHRAGLSSPNRIHLQQKLHHAANLLLNSDAKIIDIAEQCGIETVSYLTKTFKKEYGISPSTYRKTYKRFN